jgi:TolA-binding protein
MPYELKEVVGMKNLSFIILMVFSLNTVVFAAESSQQKKSMVVVKTESSSSFKGLLYKVWSRLRALNPQLKTNKTRSRSVVTMGIRGAETTGSIIEPYWKGDKTDNPEYIVELTTYTEAQQFAEDGDLNQAVIALNAFLTEYDESDLRPNAQFALAISQGGMGDVAASKKTLQIFIDENPKHPLVADAKQVIKEL